MSSQAMTLSGASVSQPSSVEAFHANLTVLRENVKLLVMSVISGRRSGDSFGRLNPDGSLLKMSRGYAQANLDGFLENSSMTFPKWGIVSGGVVGKLPMSEPPTTGKGFLLLPTPTATELGELKGKEYTGTRHALKLGQAINLAPTPTARDYKDKGNLENVPINSLLGRELGKNHGLKLQVAFVEWMMGFPMGRLNRKCSGTQLSRRKSTPSCKPSRKLSAGADA